MLWRKMRRDILSNKGSYLACIILVVLGLAFFTSFSTAVENMQLGKESLYDEQNFAQGFAEISAMPKRDVAGLAEDVEGVKQVSGRLVQEVRVHMPDRDESTYLHLISQNLEDPDRLNSYLVDEGEDLVEGEACALLDTYFTEAHQLKRGDTLEIIHRGRLEEITFNGVAMAPETVYLLRSPEAQLYPNPEQFGAAFMPLKAMWDMFPENRDRVNNLVFTLEDGASYHRVEERMEQELEPYGLTDIYPREDHLSHFLLDDQMEMMELMGTFFPVLIPVILNSG